MILRSSRWGCEILRNTLQEGDDTEHLVIRKWSVDGEKCFSYWTQIVTDCMICMRVCPYNKDFTKRRHRIGRRLASTGLRKVMLRLNDRLGYGERLKPRNWWAGATRRRL